MPKLKDQNDLAQLAIQFLDGFELAFDRFTLTIAQAWKFPGECSTHMIFSGDPRILQVPLNARDIRTIRMLQENLQVSVSAESEFEGKSPEALQNQTSDLQNQVRNRQTS